MARKPKPHPQGDGTMMLGEHRVATATGYCLTTCPACLRGDRNQKIFFAVVAIVMVLGLFCHHCP